MNQEFVLYACYGSNLNRDLFIRRYINHCSDKTPPVQDRPFTLHHQLYFGGISGSWGGQGVAFVGSRHDESVQTLGRAYLITAQQLEQIQQKEGPGPHWYGNKLKLGVMEGFEVYTLTREEGFDFHLPRLPSAEYEEAIRQGLMQTYPGIDASAYLEKIKVYTGSLMAKI